ncbi:hypothetical protein Gogos_018279 [Gossypium gossypioides]|uniref:Zinc knuckle CX2CX4HX4C domain-containing protein n=1 Tax=Gossypium gossypioides TaxID=34282 RepID=A0A7J9BDQ9_GOSGO|nr:hypothetical protein [Gossypium gossypioides]
MVAKQLGGRFLEYDLKHLNRGLMNHLKIRVELDVRKPLKRRKKIVLPLSKFTYVNFRYERLTLFCFLCGCLGPNHKFCPITLNRRGVIMDFGWNISLKEKVRRANTTNNVWLREERDDDFRETNLSMHGLGSNLRDEWRSDLGNDTIENVEGKKRPRIDVSVPNVSEFSDSLGILTEQHNAHLHQISTIANGQADREP